MAGWLTSRPAWKGLGSALALVLCLLGMGASAQPATAASSTPAAAAASGLKPESLYWHQRFITEFRVPLLDRSPAERAAVARVVLEDVLQAGGAGVVSVFAADGRLALRVDGRAVFYLLPGDLLASDEPAKGSSDATLPSPAPGASLAGAVVPGTDVGVDARGAEAVRLRLQKAVDEAREARDGRRTGEALLRVLGSGLLALVLIRTVWWLRRMAQVRSRWLLQPRSREVQPEREPAAASLRLAWMPQVRSLVQAVLSGVTWLFIVVVLDVWATYALGQFAYTRPWAEHSERWLLSVLQQFALAAANAVPGLLTAALIFLLARWVARLFSAFLLRVEQGGPSIGWIDVDTAGPTRRVGVFIVWLFALAMAYPFLPGSSSEAFKGVSVLAGLMLSLGASGVVGQVVSGLSLMYSRSLRPGEYVRIGNTEGTVALVGMFATRLHTGLGEEAVLPNAWVASQPVQNFSRLVPDGAFVLQAGVTIGYATPWRQVHEMLLEAARRTEGVAAEPAPFVVQTALSDFYVEYRLCAHGSRSAPRRRAEAISALHGHIQDVFNENGVQIMSPHYLADPAAPQVVPPEGWAPGLKRQGSK